MKILAFTDFHGHQEAFRRAKELIETEKPDLVIVAGDVTNYEFNRAKQHLTDLGGGGRPVYFVPGNMDSEDLGAWSGANGVHGLHGRCVYCEGFALIGLGGSPHGPFRTIFEFSEEEAAELLEKALKDYGGGKLIVVSHCPPKDTALDQVASGEHAGSTSVRKLVEKTQPVLVVSGHIHEAQGTDKIGSTVLVNTGPAQRGHYAKIVINDKSAVRFGRLF